MANYTKYALCWYINTRKMSTGEKPILYFCPRTRGAILFLHDEVNENDGVLKVG